MLLPGLRALVQALDVEPDVRLRLLAEPLDQLEQPRPLRRLVDCVVELGVQRDPACRSRPRFASRRGSSAARSRSDGDQLAAGVPGGDALERGADLVDLLDLGRAERGHDRAAVRDDGDESLGAQLAERLAHRHPADRELGGERVLVDASSRPGSFPLMMRVRTASATACWMVRWVRAMTSRRGRSGRDDRLQEPEAGRPASSASNAVAALVERRRCWSETAGAGAGPMPAARRLGRTPGSCRRTSPRIRCSRTTRSNAGICESWSCMPIHTAVPSGSSSRTESRLRRRRARPRRPRARGRRASATAASSSPGAHGDVGRPRRHVVAAAGVDVADGDPARADQAQHLRHQHADRPGAEHDRGWARSDPAQERARRARTWRAARPDAERRVEAVRQDMEAAGGTDSQLAEAARPRAADQLAVLADVLAARPAGRAGAARDLRVDGDRRPMSARGTPSPTSTTSPVSSWPMISGGVRRGLRVATPCTSDPQIPAAETRSGTSPGADLLDRHVEHLERPGLGVDQGSHRSVTQHGSD